MRSFKILENNTPSDTYWRVTDSQFFRTTTKIQSAPDCFDKSRFVMTSLTIFGVTEILFSFRLVLEGKTGKEIPESSRLEFLEKFFANNFALSHAEYNTSRPLNTGTIADLTLSWTLLAIQHGTWNISQIITKAISISTRILISYAMKHGIPFLVWWKLGQDDQNFQMEGKP